MRRNSRETDSWQFLSKFEISSWRYPKRAFLNQISRGPRGNSQAHWRKGLEPQFYLTVYRIVVPHIRLIQLEIIELNIGQSNLSTFWKTERFFFETQKMFERNAFFVEKNFKIWNEMILIVAQCGVFSLIWSKCQELKMRDNMLPLN